MANVLRPEVWETPASFLRGIGEENILLNSSHVPIDQLDETIKKLSKKGWFPNLQVMKSPPVKHASVLQIAGMNFPTTMLYYSGVRPLKFNSMANGRQYTIQQLNYRDGNFYVLVESEKNGTDHRVILTDIRFLLHVFTAQD